jgi:hypothetical protein
MGFENEAPQSVMEVMDHEVMNTKTHVIYIASFVQSAKKFLS